MYFHIENYEGNEFSIFEMKEHVKLPLRFKSSISLSSIIIIIITALFIHRGSFQSFLQDWSIKSIKMLSKMS